MHRRTVGGTSPLSVWRGARSPLVNWWWAHCRGTPLPPHRDLQVHRELLLFRAFGHPNILRGLDSFSDADGYYLVQEFAERGDLIDVVSAFEGRCVPEAQVAAKARAVAPSVRATVLTAACYMACTPFRPRAAAGGRARRCAEARICKRARAGTRCSPRRPPDARLLPA